MQEDIFKEQFPIEIRKELLEEAAKKAFEQGPSYVSIIQRFATTVFPHLIERIEALELSQTPQLLPLLFVQAKREYFETKEWIELNFRIYKEVSKKQDLKEEEEIFGLLQRQLKRIEKHSSTVYELACKSLPRSYAEQLDRIEAEIDKILIGHPEKLAIYTKEQKEIFFDKIKASKKHLREMSEWIAHERPKWFKWLMKEGRGFNLSLPEKWPYPVIYTIHDTLYIPLETPEHFLGIGEGKVICRTVDLDKGKILALVKPRILLSLKTAETEKELKIQEDLFDYAWRESNFLMKLQGKKGIIEVIERAVFKINRKQHLFLIEEKYEDSSLLNFILKPDLAKKELHFKTKINIVRTLLQGLINIHNANILHRDIKPQNVLIDVSISNHPKAVICDFNTACYMDEIRVLEKEGFSPVSCPPEYARAVLSRNKQNIAKATTTKMDIWGMGVVLWFTFFTNAPPWLGEKGINGVLTYLSKLGTDWFPKEFQNRPFSFLIQKMLSLDPSKRPTAVEAYEEFEFLTEIVQGD